MTTNTGVCQLLGEPGSGKTSIALAWASFDGTRCHLSLPIPASQLADNIRAEAPTTQVTVPGSSHKLNITLGELPASFPDALIRSAVAEARAVVLVVDLSQGGWSAVEALVNRHLALVKDLKLGPALVVGTHLDGVAAGGNAAGVVGDITSRLERLGAVNGVGFVFQACNFVNSEGVTEVCQKLMNIIVQRL